MDEERELQSHDGSGPDLECLERHHYCQHHAGRTLQVKREDQVVELAAMAVHELQ